MSLLSGDEWQLSSEYCWVCKRASVAKTTVKDSVLDHKPNFRF